MAIYTHDATLYPKCDQESDLWQQIELALELASNLRDMVNWDRKWLVNFNAQKNQVVSFDLLYNYDAIDMKMNGSVTENKSSYKLLALSFSSKLDWRLFYCLYC